MNPLRRRGWNPILPCGAFVFAAAPGSAALLQSEPPSERTESASSAAREFAPGVRIDWEGRSVELQGRVAMREGPLELFACSPQTREHESVVVVSARPLHVFQALGLLGIEPGHPARYDEKIDRWFPATGEPLELLIAGPAGPIPAEQWMLDRERKKPPADVPWVFAGSRVLQDGRFAADIDGTVACVVDFDSALIGLAARHSADNEELWLTANPEAVAPVGSRCTLVIRSRYHPKVDVEVQPDGSYLVESKKVSEEEIIEQLRPRDRSRTPRIRLNPSAKTLSAEFERATKRLKAQIQKNPFDHAFEIRSTGDEVPEGKPRTLPLGD